MPTNKDVWRINRKTLRSGRLEGPAELQHVAPQLAAQDTGYHYCGCRDCMHTTIGLPRVEDKKRGFTVSTCNDCHDAGCEPNAECQAPNAYGVDDDLEHISLRDEADDARELLSW